MCKHTEAIITKGKAIADIDLELRGGGGPLNPPLFNVGFAELYQDIAFGTGNEINSYFQEKLITK